MNCLLICGLLSDGGLMTCGGFLISHDGGLVISLGALVTCAGLVICLCALMTCGGFVNQELTLSVRNISILL